MFLRHDSTNFKFITEIMFWTQDSKCHVVCSATGNGNFPISITNSIYKFQLKKKKIQFTSKVYMMFVYRTTVWSFFFHLIYIFPTIYILFSFLLLFLIWACLFITNHASGSFTVYDSMIMHAWSQSPTYTETKNVVASSHLSVISRVDCSQNQLCNTFH